MIQTKRLYISADIEGIAGVTSRDQLMPDGFEYNLAREWMTGEVRAACEAALESGIEEIVVSDSHGNGQNLLIDQLPDQVTVVRNWPRPLCMMEGLQTGPFVGAAFIGYHTGATDMSGALAHTMHGGAIAELRLNGKPASETVISAQTAAEFGIPVILATGDDAYTAHAASVCKGVETVTAKWCASFTSVRTKKTALVRQEIADAMRAALKRIGEFKPLPVQDDYVLEVVCVRRAAAEILAYLPGIERVDAVTVRVRVQDMTEVSKVCAFLLSSGSLTPG